jgi:hypothetical protein
MFSAVLFLYDYSKFSIVISSWSYQHAPHDLSNEWSCQQVAINFCDPPLVTEVTISH